MKILIEYLDENVDSLERKYYSLNKSKTLEFTNVVSAKKQFDILKSLKLSTETIRIIEYHNDEADKVRKPCKIIEKL